MFYPVIDCFNLDARDGTRATLRNMIKVNLLAPTYSFIKRMVKNLLLQIQTLV